MPFLGLTKKQQNSLELEIVPREARLQLTRLIRFACDCEEFQIKLLRQNKFVNIANQVLGRLLYVLHGDDMGEYEAGEYGWHNGELELVLRIAETVELAEILADYLQEGMLRKGDVNEILEEHGCGFSFTEVDGYYGSHISLNVAPVESIPDADLTAEHPNVRKLARRMDTALTNKD